MEHADWKERWDSGRIGFHLGAVHPVLLRERERFEGTGSVLVPLAGKTADLDLLAEGGRRVLANEFIEAAARSFFAERGQTPEEAQRESRLRLSHGSITFDVGDFFTSSAALAGERFDAVFDRAALIAVDPVHRARYVDVLDALLAPNGFVLLVTLEVDAGSGPPHRVSADDVDALFGARFHIERLPSLTAHDGRDEHVFLLRRRA